MADPLDGFVPGTATAPDGTQLAYWTAGNGAPLLLIAGQALDHRSWTIAAPALCRARRVIVFDHRGVGASGTGAADRFQTRNFAEDATRVLDAAGETRVDILGHSMGGLIAQWIAIDHPHRVDRLVLAATSAGRRHGSARTQDADAALRSGDPDRIAAIFFRRRSPDATRLLTIGADATARARHFRAGDRHDTGAELGRIAAPTLVLQGGRDPLTPVDHARFIAERIPHARLTVLRGASHGILMEGGIGVEIADRFLRR